MRYCIPVIPSADLEKSLRLWRDGLGFTPDREMWDGERLKFCMLHKDNLVFMLNRRAGTAEKPDNYNGINLYWAPDDLPAVRRRLLDLGFAVSEVVARDYGQSEFFLTDDDGFNHCFGVPTKPL